MTTQTLVKTLIALCEGGQCGGEITLVTDGVTEAYATVSPSRGTRFVEQDCGLVERTDGAIVVHCGAVHHDGGQSCDGVATFTREALADTAYTADTLSTFMHPMEQA